MNAVLNVQNYSKPSRTIIFRSDAYRGSHIQIIGPLTKNPGRTDTNLKGRSYCRIWFEVREFMYRLSYETTVLKPNTSGRGGFELSVFTLLKDKNPSDF